MKSDLNWCWWARFIIVVGWTLFMLGWTIYEAIVWVPAGGEPFIDDPWAWGFLLGSSVAPC